mgnify:CR=1 FL=1
MFICCFRVNNIAVFIYINDFLTVRLYFLFFIIVYWSLLILTPLNAFAEDKWDFNTLDGFSYGSVAGEVTHGDKLRFIMKKDHCDVVQHIFTFYTWEKPDDISQLNGQKIPIKINNELGLKAEIFMVHPFLMGHMVWFDLGNYKVDKYVRLLKELKTYEIEIVDGYGFKAKKYFDITTNNWELDDLDDAFQRIESDCIELSETKEKLISQYSFNHPFYKRG